MAEYTDIFIDHFNNPRNVGTIDDAEGIATQYNVICGDTITLHLKICDEIITGAKFQTLGCSASIAVSSIMTELVIGKSIKAARMLTKKDLDYALDGIPRAKLHSIVLAIDTLNATLDIAEANTNRQNT